MHKQTVVACARIAGDGAPMQEVRTFATTTSGLLALADWLDGRSVSQHVAMEATGVYWKPVWHVLEGHFELVLANAAHVKNVPGRKTDVNDAMWLADLLAHGLIRASFVPPAGGAGAAHADPHAQAVRARARRARPAHREDPGRRQPQARRRAQRHPRPERPRRAAGHHRRPQPIPSSPGPPASSRRVKASRAELLEALRGHISAHHRFMLKLHLDHIDALDQAIAAIEQEVGARARALSHSRQAR